MKRKVFETIGEIVRVARKKLNLTQSELASVLGECSGSYISQIENGTIRPPISFIGSAICALNLNEAAVHEVLFSEYKIKTLRKIDEAKKDFAKRCGQKKRRKGVAQKPHSSLSQEIQRLV